MATPEEKPIDLSVVIVTWNSRDQIERCVRSVVEDAERGLLRSEVIVVDNASTDGTTDLLRERFPSIMLLPGERNIGFAAATNVGIRQSAGRFLLLLNPDTELLPGALATLLRTIDATPHVGLVSGLLLNPGGSLQSSGYRFPGLVQTFLDFFPLHPRLIGSSLNGRVAPSDGAAPYEVDHPLGACMLVRREVVDRVGLLGEQYFMYSEEIDWCRRIRANGWAILIAPAAKIVHFGGQSTRLMPREMFLELHRSRALYFTRYGPPHVVRGAALMARAAGLLSSSRSRDGRGHNGHGADELRQVATIYERARSGDG